MADKKPEKKADKSAEGYADLKFTFAFTIVILVMLIFIIAPAFFVGFGFDAGNIIDGNSFKEAFISFVARLFTSITFISVFTSLMFIILISYSKMRLNQVLEKWAFMQVTSSATLPAYPGMVEGVAPMPNNLPGLGGENATIHGPIAEGGHEKWQDIESKINSANPADWRLAIIEADIVLDDMLKQMGLPGENLGERLKSADSTFFSTLQEAWAAHKIRNIIAHEGSNYNLTYSEARKAIDFYRRVFQEFYFI